MKNLKAKNIGIVVPAPAKNCVDRHCPFHGFVKLHGRTFTGTVIRNLFHNTTTIEFPRQYYLPKYERYEKRRTHIKVHIPNCLGVKKGSLIKIMETRPISKTKTFVIIEVIRP